MSSHTAATFAGATEAIGSSSPTPGPPIVVLLQFFSQLVLTAFSTIILLAGSILSLVRTLFLPVLALASPIPYLLSPVIVFVNLLLEIFVTTPYNIITATLHALYPIYVFMGTALIVAAVVGLGARVAASTVYYVLAGPPLAETLPSPVEETSIKRKPVKRVSIKDEKNLRF